MRERETEVGGGGEKWKGDLPAYSNSCIYPLENTSAELWTEMDVQFINCV